MEVGNPFSFLKSIRRRIAENEVLGFLLFIERTPRHRVMEDINILFLAFLSIGCFVAGLIGFRILECYGLQGFIMYYVGLLISLLELLHCIFDR